MLKNLVIFITILVLGGSIDIRTQVHMEQTFAQEELHYQSIRIGPIIGKVTDTTARIMAEFIHWKPTEHYCCEYYSYCYSRTKCSFTGEPYGSL